MIEGRTHGMKDAVRTFHVFGHGNPFIYENKVYEEVTSAHFVTSRVDQEKWR